MIRNGFEPATRLAGWRAWSPAAAVRARAHLAEPAVRSIVVGEQFSALHTLSPTGDTAGLGALIDAELGERTARLTAAIAELKLAEDQWGRDTTAVIIDTNLLMRAGPRLARVNWDRLLRAKPVGAAFVIPIQVIEELDDLKLNRNGEIRANATYALKWLMETLPTGGDAAPFEIGSRNTTIRVWVDDNNRVPLPGTDRDIIDRAMQLQPFATRTVIASMDQSMVFRAVHYGLEAILLQDDDVPEREGAQR